MHKRLPIRTRFALFCTALVAVTAIFTAVSVGRVTNRAVRTAVAEIAQQDQDSSDPAAIVEAAAEKAIWTIRVRLIITVVIGVVLAILGAEALGALLLRPIRRMTATAAVVRGPNLGLRMADGGNNDEVQQLGATINAMLDRIDLATEAQQHFVFDASHELRTPLALLATEIDVALESSDERSPREALLTIRGDVQHANDLLDAILLLARSGGVTNVEDFAFHAACTDIVDRFGRDAEIEANILPVDAVGDAALLGRLISNLVGNAVKYRTPRTAIWVELGTIDSSLRFAVTNDVSSEALLNVERWFDRFWRDSSGNVAKGFGLGLPIAKNIVIAHGGRISVVPCNDTRVRVEVLLPAARAASLAARVPA